MARLGVTKKKMSPRTVELRRLKKELKRVSEQLESRERELAEATEQQTATGEILRVIARPPTDLQSVLDTVVEYAARLCDAQDAVIFRLDGDVLQRVAIYGSLPMRGALALTRGSVSGRAVVDRQTIHVHDIEAESEADFPDIDKTGSHGGSRARTRLAVPLLRDGVALGAINVRRMEVRPFTDKQIALLTTFADQAVIAIENVRLFRELGERNAELREALEHQTATAEVLGIISRSPTVVQPVLDAIVESAARLCNANLAWMSRVEGERYIFAAFSSEVSQEVRERFGQTPRIPGRESVHGRALVDRSIIHVSDIREEPELQRSNVAQATETRTVLAVPMMREGLAMGAIVLARYEVRPFSQREIELITTFADQAVIAIENVRLFQELKEALEQQTATSEILGVIASSPTDIQPVLNVVAENAARLCEANDARIMRVEGE
ncbi:MAG TPA: GAF domain-containing protein, partial [Blastocatellia bacterium]|nr:GAF domain-containing protein [Blastocatellia bacterium]